MSSNQRFFRKKGALELFKFSLYLTLPLAAGLVYANPQVMNKIILRLRLIEYPEAGPKPPVGEEIFQYRDQVMAVQQQIEKDRQKGAEK
eukprot:gene37921-46068_t